MPSIMQYLPGLELVVVVQYFVYSPNQKFINTQTRQSHYGRDPPVTAPGPGQLRAYGRHR